MSKKFLNLILLLLTCLTTPHTMTMKRSFDQTSFSQQSISNLTELKQQQPLKKQKTNTDHAAFACAYCNKTFPKRYHFDLHMNIHTGEKPYGCHLCDKTFTQKGNLNTHIKTHTGEKPYKCDFCIRSFSRNEYLKKHILTHIKNCEGATDIVLEQLELFPCNFINPALIPDQFITKNTNNI